MTVVEQIVKARKVGTPLIGVSTPDPAQTIRVLTEEFEKVLDSNKIAEPFYAVQWDSVNGYSGVNENGGVWANQIGDSVSLLDALLKAKQMKPYGVIFIHQSHRFLSDDPQISQAIWNLRDEFKQHLETLILLGPEMKLPAELAGGDVQVFDEPYPTPEELESVVEVAYLSKGLDSPAPAVLEKATGQLMGLSMFPAEQVAMMSMTPKGLDMAQLVERRRQSIDRVGLKVYRGTETFKDVVGLQSIKRELTLVRDGRMPPRVVITIEEMEKMFAGARTDSSGVSQYQMGFILSWMQDWEANGVICYGPPGTGKSLMGKAFGNECGVPTLNLNMGDMQSELVGSSQRITRDNFKVIEAMAGKGRAFFIGTCNSVSALPNELRRRFRVGMYFFDLLDAEERDGAWKYYTAKYKLKDKRPDDTGYTASEIWQCCDKAWQYDKTPVEVSGSVVPISVSGSEMVEAMRKDASGRFLSASRSGLYMYQQKAQGVEKRKVLD